MLSVESQKGTINILKCCGMMVGTVSYCLLSPSISKKLATCMSMYQCFVVHVGYIALRKSKLENNYLVPDSMT